LSGLGGGWGQFGFTPRFTGQTRGVWGGGGEPGRKRAGPVIFLRVWLVFPASVRVAATGRGTKSQGTRQKQLPSTRDFSKLRKGSQVLTQPDPQRGPPKRGKKRLRHRRAKHPQTGGPGDLPKASLIGARSGFLLGKGRERGGGAPQKPPFWGKKTITINNQIGPSGVGAKGAPLFRGGLRFSLGGLFPGKHTSGGAGLKNAGGTGENRGGGARAKLVFPTPRAPKFPPEPIRGVFFRKRGFMGRFFRKKVVFSDGKGGENRNR